MQHHSLRVSSIMTSHSRNSIVHVRVSGPLSPNACPIIFRRNPPVTEHQVRFNFEGIIFQCDPPARLRNHLKETLVNLCSKTIYSSTIATSRPTQIPLCISLWNVMHKDEVSFEVTAPCYACPRCPTDQPEV